MARPFLHWPVRARSLPALIAPLLLVASALHAQPVEPMPEWAQRYLDAEVKGQRFGHAWLEPSRQVRRLVEGAERLAVQGQPAPPPGVLALKGTFRMPVLAATYSDVTPRYEPVEYDAAFFGAQWRAGRYSLRQFYEEASGGQFTFAGTVSRWIRLSLPRVQYMDHTNPAHGMRGELNLYIREVLDSADAFIDWSQFDNDGPDGVSNSGDDDGFVDMVTFLHPLADGVCRKDALGGPVATGFRLSRMGTYSGAPYTTRLTGASGQPLRVDDFVLSAALNCDGSSISTMNINIHEMGHALGLPDLNDLDRSSFGVGVWDVMGYGLYATAGIPSQLGAWSRRQVGWATVTTVTASARLTLNPAIAGRSLVRLNIPGTNEYYLLENRQRTGADVGLPGAGLVMWHVDDAVLLPAVQSYRGTENEERPGLAVVQADGARHLQLNINRGDAGDIFPGSSNVRLVTDETTPNLKGNLGALSRLALRDITPTSDVITLDVEFASLLIVRVSPEQPATRIGGSIGLVANVVSITDGPVSLPVTWTSLDPSVASVSSEGTVSGLSAGSARITATAADASSTIVVRVAGPIVVAALQRTTPVTLGEQGYSAALQATGGLEPLLWTAIDPLPEGLTLSSSGTLTGESRFLGDAVFRVAVADGLGQRVEANVSVTSAMPTIARTTMLDAVAGGPPLAAPSARALDLAGNRNGRLDVGDVLLHLKRTSAISGGSVSMRKQRRPEGAR